MEYTENITVIEIAPEIPITLQEYADQYEVCPKTVEKWFKHGKKVKTINLDFSETPRQRIPAHTGTPIL